MKAEAQRIAIAEACGWKVQPVSAKDGIPTWLTYLPGGKYVGVFSWKGLEKNLPDYLNDLNAMHEAENILTDTQWNTYLACLTHVVGQYKKARFRVHATAAQRGEAFLRTIGKWESK